MWTAAATRCRALRPTQVASALAWRLTRRNASGGSTGVDPRPKDWAKWQKQLYTREPDAAYAELMKQTSFAVDADPRIATPVALALGVHLKDTDQVDGIVSILQSAEDVPPEQRQLYAVAFSNFAFFWIFGFVDNALMICFGDVIDTRLGFMFGFSTMACAALGNAFSNGCGIGLGTIFEIFGLMPTAKLTAAQAMTQRVSRYRQFGTFWGMVIGCLCGMAPLLIIDAHAREEEKKRESHEDLLFHFAIDRVRRSVGAERATIFLLDAEAGEMYSRAETHGDKLRVKRCEGIVGDVLGTEKAELVRDVKADRRFQEFEDFEKEAGCVARDLLCAPLFVGSKAVGAVSVLNSEKQGGFTDADLLHLSKICTQLSNITGSARLDVHKSLQYLHF